MMDLYLFLFLIDIDGSRSNTKRCNSQDYPQQHERKKEKRGNFRGGIGVVDANLQRLKVESSEKGGKRNSVPSGHRGQIINECLCSISY